MPSETDLPAVVAAGSPAPAAQGPGDAAEGAPPGGADRPRNGSGSLLPRAAGIGAVAVLGLLVALGVATLLGEGFREALLVEVEDGPVGAEPSYSDAPREAARFFADRDSVRVAVPRDMTVADFLALYHLENNPGARAALREQLGAAAPGDLLREGDRVTLPLTLRREDAAAPGPVPEPDAGPGGHTP